MPLEVFSTTSTPTELLKINMTPGKRPGSDYFVISTRYLIDEIDKAEARFPSRYYLCPLYLYNCAAW